MRFYNRRWATGGYGALKCDQIERAYEQHLHELGDDKIKKFVDEVSLHDALIDLIEIKELVISADFITGCADRGFQSVRIEYIGGCLLYPRIDRFEKILNDRQTRVLYNEFDRDDIRKTHSLLLWPEKYVELTIRFDHIAFTETPVSDYAFRNYGAVLRDESVATMNYDPPNGTANNLTPAPTTTTGYVDGVSTSPVTSSDYDV